ncbi:response regulator receiver domain-containing protein [Pseudoduganella lurida]|uniref:Response regulator receiver domain-containing protein n=1 Tax=Pseudoduganella lurida TaxID=1036180 RepID=A0A562R3H2_9BURK|nr:response regulator [Pseudoduganella lurida]TWI63619.1 response regulator receiver domain-containing protein [Pseudoduganella lurida]
MDMTDALAASTPLAPAPHVLHVDADDTTALILATLLVPEIRVSRVDSMLAAAARLDNEAFDLMIVDSDLPDGDGQELVDSFRARGCDTPVLLYSARQPSLHHQAHAYLPKPWTSPRQLWQSVCRLMDLDVHVQR